MSITIFLFQGLRQINTIDRKIIPFTITRPNGAVFNDPQESGDGLNGKQVEILRCPRNGERFSKRASPEPAAGLIFSDVRWVRGEKRVALTF